MKGKLAAPIIFIASIMALTFHFNAIAYIDAPHNESNTMWCGSCHGYEIFWVGTGSYNTLCQQCHTASSCPISETGTGPQALTHTDSDENALAECRTCHDPHYQKQMLYKNTDASNLYLASGTIVSYSYNAVSKESTLTYSIEGITYKDGWDAKKLTGKTWECRGTILFPNVNKLGYSYPLIGVNEVAKTITVKGDVSPAYQYTSPPSSFAVMYGQYIKDNINDKPVKFFDRRVKNSFADGDGTYNGVCEVCHTETMYHRNDGLGAPHYPAVRCSICHVHLNGFADSDHTGSSGSDCEDCHGHDDGWVGGSYYGTTQSHSTHTENDSDDLKGPFIDCDVCHDTNNYPFFKSGTDGDGKYNLSETDVCDNCHSPNGAFDGVDDAVIGAKNNWVDGVYESPTLKSGKEKWCAGCHDDQPAYSLPEIEEPVILDNPDATFVNSWPSGADQDDHYGDNFQYNYVGTGEDTATWQTLLPRDGLYAVFAWWSSHWRRSRDARYTVFYDGGSETISTNQEVSGGQWNYLGTFPFSAGIPGSVVLTDQSTEGDYVVADAIKWEQGIRAPNITGDNTTYGFYVTGHKLSCLECHDASKKHIDHEHRTYQVNENTGEIVNPYCASYRLRDVDGNPCMNIPRKWGGSPNWKDFSLCFECHNASEVLVDNIDLTNFWNNDGQRKNSHLIHLNIGFTTHFDSDWDLKGDSTESCITCHNVHGSPSKAMVRHGEFISNYGATGKVPALNFSYVLPYSGPTATATWRPNIPSADTYDVYAWWTWGGNRASNAPYRVYYDGGSQTIRVNQKSSTGNWNYLGTFPFASGTSGYVVLGDDANGYVIADAVGWDQDGDGNPDIIVDDADPEFSIQGADWLFAETANAYNGAEHYHVGQIPTDPDATLEQSVGGFMNYGGQQLWLNSVCGACHGPVTYYRTPTFVNPRVMMQKAEPSSVDNNGAEQVLLTAYVYSPDYTISSVTIDLTPIDGSATQVMYDNGTNGDAISGDKIYSYLTTVPVTVDTGLKRLTVTGTDSQSRTGTAEIDLVVANPGWVIVDNWDADFYGYWASGTTQEIYNINIRYHASGTGSDTAVFTPALSQTGSYNVYAYWTSGSNRASNAPYTINYSGGSDTVRVNQKLNGSQFVYLGTYLFNAQAGYTSVIVDNEDAVFVGSWSQGPSTWCYGMTEQYTVAGTGSKTATYTPDLPQAGNYDVYAWWTWGGNRASNAPYTINYSGGSDIVLVNQEQGGGGWTYLGTYYFDAGTGGSVVLSDDADEYVIADAVKWQLPSTQQGVVLSDDADGYVMADAILFEPAD